MTAQHRRAAPAAGAAGVNVLLFTVEQQQPAVGISVAEHNSVLHEQITHDLASDISEVAGQDKVEVLRLLSRNGQVCLDRVEGFASFMPMSIMVPIVTAFTYGGSA